MILDSWHWQRNSPERAVERIVRHAVERARDVYVYLIRARVVVMDEFDLNRMDCCVVTVSPTMHKSTILARLMEGCSAAASEDEARPQDSLRERIMAVLRKGATSAADVATALSHNRRSIESMLYLMKRDGLVEFAEGRDGLTRKYVIRNERREAA